MESGQYLLLTCKNCNMKFETKEQLQNHASKFCASSDYGDLNKLQRKLEMGNQESLATPFNLEKNLSLDEINAFLRGDRVAKLEDIGSMDLNKLRNQIQVQEKQYDRALKDYHGKREHEVREDLNNLRLEKQQLRAKRKQEEGVLLDLLKEIQQRREREVRARAEKEQIAQALRDLEKKKLNAIEFEKKRELKKLSAEREALRLKEEELADEIERLQKRMNENEDLWKAERDKINTEARGENVEINMSLLQKRQMELSKERGEAVAFLNTKKNSLDNERARIMDDLKKIKKGDFGTIRKNFNGIMAGSQMLNAPEIANKRNVPDSVKEMSEQWTKDMERLEELRKQQQNFQDSQKLYQVETNPNEKKKQFMDKVSGLVKQNDSTNPQQRAKYLGYIYDDLKNKDPTRNNSVKNLMNPKNPEVVEAKESYQMGQDPLNSFKSPPPRMASDKQLKSPKNKPNIFLNSKPNEPERLNTLNQSLNPNQQLNYPHNLAPQPPNQMYNTHNPQQSPTQGNVQSPPNPYQPPFYPYYNPYYPYPPFDPYYGMNPYMQQPPPPSNQPEEDQETQTLKKELKKLKRKLKSKEKDDFYQGMQDALSSVQQRLVGNRPSSPLNEELLPEEKVMKNVQRQEQNELRVLSNLPKDSELYNARLEHYKEMSQIRMRMEGMMQELTMQRMRKNFDREMQLEEKRLENEQWIEDQKRSLIASKIPVQELTHRKTKTPLGLYIFWDFLLGMPGKYRQYQLVYALYDEGELKQDAKLVNPANVSTDPYNETTVMSIFASEDKLKNVPATSSLVLTVEVQGLNTDGRAANVGWTTVDLYGPGEALNEGMWKLPLLVPPTEVNIDIREIKKMSRVIGPYLYIRVVPTGFSSKLLSVKVEPEVTEPQYNIPPIHQLTQHPQPGIRTPSRHSQLSRHTVRSDFNPLSNKGIAIRLENLVGFLTKNYLKFRARIMQGDSPCMDSKGQPCVWTSESVNALGTDAQALPGNRRIPGTNMWSEKPMLTAKEVAYNSKESAGMRFAHSGDYNLIEIDKQNLFRQNFYHLLEEDQWSNPVYLIVEVLEKLSSRTATPVPIHFEEFDDDKFNIVAWSIFQVSNLENHSLSIGSFELNLYKPPVTYPNIDFTMIERVEGTLRFTLFEPSSDRMLSSGKQSIAPSLAAPETQAFLENLTPQYNDAKYFEKGDGFDFYVDGARFLADNASCTKVLVRAYTSNLEKVGAPMGGLPELDSSVYNPTYGFRTEFRAPIFDPTTTIMVTVVTIDTHHKEVMILGYGVINVFLDKFRKEQPQASSHQEFILNKGSYQIPIYSQEPFRKPPFGLHSFKKLEMIPCGTLLVRLREAAKADDGMRVLSINDVVPNEWYIRGVVVPPPKYEERAYNTSYAMPSHIERYLYEERLRRVDMTVRDATSLIQNQMGHKLELDDEEMLDWIDQKLQITPRTPMFDMKFFARYNPKLGFRIAIDAIHNTPTADSHVVIFCLNPPASLYTSTVVTQDVQFTTKADWESPLRSPQFLDGFHTYKNSLFDRHLHFILEVRSINFAKQRPEVLNVGWTILPVFSADGYVQSGIYQLPLFRGSVPADILPELTTNDPWAYLMGSLGKHLHFLELSSVIVRLVDTQRDGHFRVPLDVNRISYKYIPENLTLKLAYNAAAQSKNMKTKRLKSIVPSNYSTDAYLKRVNEAVANELGLSHVVA